MGTGFMTPNGIPVDSPPWGLIIAVWLIATAAVIHIVWLIYKKHK